MRSEKVFDFGGFLAQWETVLDRVFAFDATERNVLWVALPLANFYSVRKGPHPVALRD